jgi:hypothetical protein
MVRVNRVLAPDVILHNAPALLFSVPAALVADGEATATSVVEVSIVNTLRLKKLPLSALFAGFSKVVDRAEFRREIT